MVQDLWVVGAAKKETSGGEKSIFEASLDALLDCDTNGSSQ